MQNWLDAGVGACPPLPHLEVRHQVEHCLLHFDGSRYLIDSFVIMPNHVHALIALSEDRDLSRLLQGIKSVSANRCNKLLDRKGQFWFDESYDHIVRDHQELAAFREYILQNPANARLKPDEYSLELRNILEG